MLDSEILLQNPYGCTNSLKRHSVLPHGSHHIRFNQPPERDSHFMGLKHFPEFPLNRSDQQRSRMLVPFGPTPKRRWADFHDVRYFFKGVAGFVKLTAVFIDLLFLLSGSSSRCLHHISAEEVLTGWEVQVARVSGADS